MTSQVPSGPADGAAVRPVRAPRRAVRLSDSVGTDESVLRTTLPAPVPDAPAAPRRTAASGSPDAVLARLLERAGDLGRSADDSGTGWGDGTDSNDDRLARDRPPHW